MLKIGITGGIGSGKSTVARIFEGLGIPVYYADSKAKEMMSENGVLAGQIKGLFGEEAYLKGELNRSYIASKAFGNQELLERLNALVHPAVFKDFDDWCEKQKSAYVLKEAALLFESGSYRSLDYVIVVSAPRSLRIERTMQRDGVEKAAVLARMRKQLSEKERLSGADFVILNNGKKPLIPQVLELHRKFLFASES
jgi:dephospho-CoA kinase